MSERTLREYYLPAYKAAVDAGVEMVMTSFNILDGVPAASNKKLVDGILRKEWKFGGVVISDYNSFREMITHGVAENEHDAACLAINAGNDIEMMSATYIGNMESLIKEGKVSLKQIDKAVERVLKLKRKRECSPTRIRTRTRRLRTNWTAARNTATLRVKRRKNVRFFSKTTEFCLLIPLLKKSR